jgi:hypothetical protein
LSMVQVMGEHGSVRVVRSRRYGLVLAVTLIVSLAELGSAWPALASERHLEGGFGVFADCPLNNPAVRSCLVDETTSGVLTIGRRTVPIDKTIMVQGGTGRENPETLEEAIFGAEDGMTISRTALSVPGGLSGIIATGYLPASLREGFDAYVSKGVTGVTLTAELAQPANPGVMSKNNLLVEEETAMRVGLKVKLSNPFLGNDCYIGSSSDPIMLNMTTGNTSPPPPNKPVRGTSGRLVLSEVAEIATLTGTSLVDNTFAVPAATGCGGTSSALVDAALDGALGLPSPAGHNTAILTGKLTGASVPAVDDHALGVVVGTG